jgi:hypothetical protein
MSLVVMSIVSWKMTSIVVFVGCRFTFQGSVAAAATPQ